MINISDNVAAILKDINKYIDQTLLRFDIGINEYVNFADKSEKYGFRSIVVPSAIVKHVATVSKLPITGVAGFPFGYCPIEAKLREIDEIARGGGKEVDVVLNLVYLKEGLYNEVEKEVKALVNYAHEIGLKIKVIIETSILDIAEIARVAKILVMEGADFIKTNTGYGPRGVCLEDVILLKSYVGNKTKIKAAGSIRTALDAAYFIVFGADVLGTSKGIEIVEEARRLLMRHT